MSPATPPCTNCGAELPAPSHHAVVTCPYCGATATAQPGPSDVMRVWRGELSMLLEPLIAVSLSLLVFVLGAAPLFAFLFFVAAEEVWSIIAVGAWMLPTILIVKIWYRSIQQRLVDCGSGKGEVSLLRDGRLLVRLRKRQQAFDLRSPLVCKRYWYAYNNDDHFVKGALVWLHQGQSSALLRCSRVQDTCGMPDRNDAIRLTLSDSRELLPHYPPTQVELHPEALQEIDSLLDSPPGVDAT